MMLPIALGVVALLLLIFVLPGILNILAYIRLRGRFLAFNGAEQLARQNGVVLMPVSTRSHYLARVLHALKQADGINDTIIIFSQDGNDSEVSKLVKNWLQWHPRSLHMRHARPYLLLPNLLLPLGLSRGYLISANIYSLLRLSFDWLKCDWVIVLEDDLVPGRDFLSFFRGVRRQILSVSDFDDRILAVSGWSNWNFSRPASEALDDNTSLYKLRLTPFGAWSWAIDRKRWPRVRRGWSNYFRSWDFLMQETNNRHKLQSLTPVISRVLNIGMKGVNFTEDEQNPSLPWRTQTVLDRSSDVTTDPERPFIIDPVPVEKLVFAR